MVPPVTTPSRVDDSATPSATFPPPTGAQILRALRAPVVAYGWTLLGAVVMTVLILVAANVGSTGEATGVESDDTNSVGVLVGMPFQIAAMALLGSLHFTDEGFGASLFLPPLVLTLVYVATTVRSARRSEVVPAAGTRGLLGVIVGFATAVVVTLLTWALAMRTDGVSIHAASAPLFFGVWVLTGVASYVGTSRGAGASLPSWFSSEYVAAARVWLGSVAVWVAGAFVVSVVAAAIREGVWFAIVAPLWGVTSGLYTYAIAHLGGVSLAGQTVALGDFDTVWTIAMVVGALLLSVLTSIAWHLRRDTSAASLAQPQSWVTLPATYAAGGILVVLVPSVVLGGALGGFGGSVTVRPALWSVLVLVLWGGAVEASSRFVAPSLATGLPPRLERVLRGPERPVPVADGGTATPVAARPLTPEERARYKRYSIIGGGLVALALAAWITVSVVNSQFFGPEKQVRAYLDAVVDGDLEEARDLAPTDDDMADDGLLTSEVYRGSENRVTGYELGDVEEDGDTVTVEVELEGTGSTSSTELHLTRDGKTAVLFDSWRVTDGGLARPVSVSAPENAEDLTVNDVAVGSVEGDVWLLPGDYDIDPFAGNQWLESSGEPVTITAEDGYQYAEVSGAVASEEFRTEVQRQLDDLLAECMASTELEPENCPNSAYAGTDVRNVTWTMTTPPVPDFDSFDGTFPADLSYGDSGQAVVTYESDESYGFGPKDWQPQQEESELYLDSLTVTEEGDGLLVTIGS